MDGAANFTLDFQEVLINFLPELGWSKWSAATRAAETALRKVELWRGDTDRMRRRPPVYQLPSEF